MSASIVGKQLADVEISKIIRDMGLGIAQAQFELDRMSMRLAQMMSGAAYEEEVEGPEGELTLEKRDPILVKFDGKDYSMLQLGFTPSFYQFVDTIMEVKMSISMSSESSSTFKRSSFSAQAKGSIGFLSAKASLKATTVSASFASKYQYSAEGSSLIRSKLVPVPPPAILEERIRRIMDRDLSDD